jgi:hypothetical protein
VNDTTRRHPRSLAEAWPRDYADPIERPPRNRWRLRDLVLLGVAIVAALVALAYKFAAMVTT